MSKYEELEKVLDEYVRPYLSSHEGGVEVVEVTDGILRIKLLGKCSGCPSANLTTEEFIKEKVMDRMEEIKDVILVNQINPELLDFARKLLNHEV